MSSDYLISAKVYQNASQSDNDSKTTDEGGISTESPDKIQINSPENNKKKKIKLRIKNQEIQ
jgi:hypothetical protein